MLKVVDSHSYKKNSTIYNSEKPFLQSSQSNTQSNSYALLFIISSKAEMIILYNFKISDSCHKSYNNAGKILEKHELQPVNP